IGYPEGISASESASVSSQEQVHGQHTRVSSDLIGALLKRGEKLREAMVTTADEDNELDEPGVLGTFVKSTTPPGKLFKAILTSNESDIKPDSPGEDESALIESVFLHNDKAVDLVLGEEDPHFMMNSSDSSPESSVVSEAGEPLYDESLLKDLFYTTPAVASDTESDNTVSTDDNDDDEQPLTHVISLKSRKEKKKTRTAKGRQQFPQQLLIQERDEKDVSSVEYIDPNQTNSSDTPEKYRGHRTPTNSSADSFPSTKNGKESSPNPHEFIENIGPEKLTALGRVDAARVIVDSLGVNGDNVKSGTYFVEYSFPASMLTQRQKENISMATELTRIASKKLQDAEVSFNHRSVFPALFNSTVIDYWWRRPLTFRVYFRESGKRMPVVVGVATFPLKTVLQSDTLSSSASLQIKHSVDHIRREESSSSSSVYHASSSDDHPLYGVSFGPLLVKVELMTDGKQLHVKPSAHKKPPLPATTTPTKTADHLQVTKPAQIVGQVFGKASHSPTKAASLSDKMLLQTSSKFDRVDEPEREPLTLFLLLWIPEGKDLIQHGYHSNQGLVTKNNLYLVCRMFWCDELSKSRVCWGSANPSFGFKQVAPVLLTSSLLQRVCNNFMVIEVWNRIASQDHGDQLVGLVKLPLHQLYLSYRDPKITKTLLKSKYPVVAFDEWSSVTNPFTHIQHGQLRVLLAMGLEEQVAAILAMKCGGDLLVGISNLRPDHHLDNQRVSSRDDHEGLQELVEHQFEITVEDIRGLCVFGSTVWGETDCFVQYHFPFQRDLQHSDFSIDAIPILQPHRTPTTLCVPDPAFHDVTRHAFKLPQGFPVQRHLLAAFTGSRLAATSVPGSGGVPFELWRRYYYPNIRDQMVAKASLPLAKLCAMVTMQKQGEANIQSFSLPLTVLAGDEVDGMRQDRVRDTGLLDVTVKYQQVVSRRLKEGQTTLKEGDNQICLSLEVIQACGLKAAASLHARSNPNLSYPAKVGVNTYIVIHFPFGRKRKHVTRTVARTFSPEFTYSADLLLPIVLPAGVGGKKQLSLAEQLEDAAIVFEVWHQMSRGMSGNQVTRSGDYGKGGREGDVLLGVGRVPLIMLLTRKTGVKGWYPIYPHTEGDVHDASSHDDPEKTIGGVELRICFSEKEDRDHVVHISRGVGWSPPPGVEYIDDRLGEDEMSKEGHWEFCLKISKAWIPPSELNSIDTATKKEDRNVKAYARYKLYNKAPIVSRLTPVKDSGDGKFICELKHCKEIMLPETPSVTWYMREENLEIQVWLSKRRHDADSNSRKRDRLMGSAFVDVSSILISQQRKHRQISGLYPLFRSGASDLFGACVHVQAALKWCYVNSSDPEFDLSQDIVNSDDSGNDASPLEDSDARSSTIKSTQDHSAKPSQPETQLPVIDSNNDDTFTAHVIIEQALHLPTVPGSNGERTLPSVYVSYQMLPSVPPSYTSVVDSSTNPTWEYQRLERISYSSLNTSQGLEFKVWHTSGKLEEGHTKIPDSTRENPDSSSGADRVLGVVLFDLSPLLAGMRQLIGWYNVTDFNGDCKGQIKIGVSPVIPVSPPRSLPASRQRLHLPSSTQQDVELTDSSSLINQRESHQMIHQDGSVLRLHTDKKPQDDQTSGFRPHTLDTAIHTLDADVGTAPVSSTSFLLSQLRHSMKELDVLQQNLNVKLKAGSAVGDSSVLTQERPSVVALPSFFSDTVATRELKGSETIHAKHRIAEEPDLRSKTASETEHKEMEFRRGVISLNDKEIITPGDRRLLSSPFSVRDDTVEGIGDTIKQGEVEASSSKDNLDPHKSEDGFDSFFGLERDKSAENRRPSIDSELSISDVSDDLSVSGYVQDNSKTARFTDIKDSWLSSEDEDIPEPVEQSENPGLSKSPSVISSEKLYFNPDANNDEVKDKEIVDSSMKGDQQGVRRRIIMDNVDFIDKASADVPGESAAGGSVNSGSDAKNATFQTDEENDYNSPVYYRKPQSRELPTSPVLSVPRSGHHLKNTLPNFFMPTEQLVESMRSLRLGSSNQRYGSTNSHSKLLARSSHLKSDGQHTKGNLTEQFTKRKPVYKARRDERPPISRSEAARIAKIFNSGSV
ncbi:unnamed protein product, partial [Porites evermanni]